MGHATHEGSDYTLSATALNLIIVSLILMLTIIVGLVIMMCIYRRRLMQLSKQLSNMKDAPQIIVSHSSKDVSLLSINKLNDEDKISKSSSLSLAHTNDPTKESSQHEKEIAECIEENSAQLDKTRRIYKSMKSMPPSQQMILKDQMKKICEDALAKKQQKQHNFKSSLDDVNELLNEFKSDKKITPVTIDRDKSNSEPHLDIYDNAPTNLPIYDSVVRNKNIVIEDNDTKYLLALSGEVGPEPDYINAQCRYT